MEPGQTLEPMQGVTIRKNAKNKFVVFELHYSADPAKRDPAYIEHIKSSMPIRQFKQEYELVWDSFEGLPVYADWDQTIHGVNRRIDPHIGSPLLLGLDFGLTPAMVVCQLQDEGLCVLREFTATNMGVKRFLAMVIPQLKVEYPLWQDLNKDYVCFIDPSGFFRKDTDETTCASVMEEAGFGKIIPGPVQFDERKNAVDTWLCRRTKHGPSFLVSLPNCPVLVQGFQGGYRYPDGVLEKEPTVKLRPVKDKFSHCHDALQGVCAKILGTRPQQVVHVPKPTYSFLSQNDHSNTRRF